jgi:hypothetical protein
MSKCFKESNNGCDEFGKLKKVRTFPRKLLEIYAVFNRVIVVSRMNEIFIHHSKILQLLGKNLIK